MTQRWIEKGKASNGIMFITAFSDWKAVFAAWGMCVINNLTSFWSSDMLTSKQEVSNGFTRL